MNLQNVQNSLKNTQSIKKQAYDRSTIIDCMEQKIKDLQEAKERIIYLETQLKMAKENFDLQKAEFSFQRSELEAEIETLKSIDQQNKIALSRHASQLQANCSVDIQLEKEKAQAIQQKYLKWKKRARDLQSEKKNLKSVLKQYDNENSKLKGENIELQGHIDLQNKTLDEERLASYSLSSETENYSRKLQKAENKISKLMENNRYLVGQIQNLTSENQTLKDQIPSLKNELKSLKKQYKEEIESSQQRFKAISAEKAEIESQLMQTKIDLTKRNMEIEDISQEKIDIDSSNTEFTTKITDLDKENQKLKLNNQSLQAKINRHQETIEQYKSIQPSLINCETEMTTLCDIIGIDPESVDKPWQNLQNSIKELVSIRNSYQKIKEQNSILQKRVSRLQLENKQESQVKPLTTNSPEKDEYYENITKSMNQIKKENDILNSKVDFYRNKCTISENIVQMHNKLVNQIVDLHSAMFDSDNQSLRPLILCIIFAQRFIKIKSFLKSANDAQSLHVFQPRVQVGAEGKLSDISEKVASLSQDLVSAKTKISEFTIKHQQVSEVKENSEFELRNAKDQLALTTKKLEYLKNRLYELQEDMSVLISPEVYQETCNKITDIEAENNQLKKTIRDHGKEIHKHEIFEKSLQDQIEKIKVEKKQLRSNMKEMKAQFEEKERDFEAMKMMIREKNKELLSLERTVTRHTNQKKTDTASINALAAENQGMLQNIDILDDENLNKRLNSQFQQSIKLVAMKNSGSGISSIINPLFLQ